MGLSLWRWGLSAVDHGPCHWTENEWTAGGGSSAMCEYIGYRILGSRGKGQGRRVGGGLCGFFHYVILLFFSLVVLITGSQIYRRVLYVMHHSFIHSFLSFLSFPSSCLWLDTRIVVVYTPFALRS